MIKDRKLFKRVLRVVNLWIFYESIIEVLVRFVVLIAVPII